MSAPSDGARADARKRLAESRCWALVAGNPCEGRAGHEGAHTALSMAGAWLYATAAPRADEVDSSGDLGLLIFEDAQTGGTRKIVERILGSDWLAGVIADAKAEALREFALNPCDRNAVFGLTETAQHFGRTYSKLARERADRIEQESGR